MARKKKEIDLEQFKKLCELQCTLPEIAGFFDCCDDTIQRWCARELGMKYSEAFEKYSAGGRISLRRYQFKLAEHNASMAIWLGKQYLGQRDQIDANVNTDGQINEILDYMKKEAN